jgi:hypothetical protein
MDRMVDPASDAFVVTPSDDTVLKNVRSLYVGGTGHVTVITAEGRSCLFSAVPVGTILPIRCTKVMAATTATLIVALI